jgi:hypothetical protein
MFFPVVLPSVPMAQTLPAGRTFFPGGMGVPACLRATRMLQSVGPPASGSFTGKVARIHLWNQVRLMVTVKGIFMEKWMCYGSMGVAGLLLLLFLLDIFAGFPFGKISVVVDVFGILASGVVGYLAYDAYRDLR